MKHTIYIGTHGDFCKEIMQSAQMIIGEMQNTYPCPLLPTESLKDYLEKAEQLINIHYQPGDIVLVDLRGGTPSNAFTFLAKKYDLTLITGLNLPLLIESYLYLQDHPDDVAGLKDQVKKTYEEAFHIVE